MSTTSIFVELLIGGIQATIWIILIVISVFKIDSFDQVLTKLSPWSGIVTVTILALWYTIGIIIDRIGAVLFQKFLNPKKVLLKIRWVANSAKEIKHDVHLSLMLKEGNLSSYLDYYRSRIRIMRFTVLNIFLIAISLIVFVQTSCSVNVCVAKNSIISWIIVIGSGIVIIAWSILGMLEIGFDNNLERAKIAIKQNQESKNK